MTHNRQTILLRLYSAFRVSALAGIFVYLAFLIVNGRASLEPQFAGTNVVRIGVAFLVAVIAYQFLFVAWIMMLRRTGYYSPGRLREYARVWWVSYMYRYVPGKVLLIAERTRMGASLGIPVAAGAAMPVIETILAVFAGSIVSLLAVNFYSSGSVWLLPALGACMLIAIFLLPIILHWFTQQECVRTRFPDLQSVSFASSDIIALVIPFLLHYLLIGVAVFLLTINIYPTSWSDLPGLCGIYALSHTISLVVVLAPAGLGVREGTFAVQLQGVLPGSVAGALAIAARVLLTITEIACFLVVLLAYGRRTKARKSNENTSP